MVCYQLLLLFVKRHAHGETRALRRIIKCVNLSRDYLLFNELILPLAVPHWLLLHANYLLELGGRLSSYLFFVFEARAKGSRCPTKRSLHPPCFAREVSKSTTRLSILLLHEYVHFRVNNDA